MGILKTNTLSGIGTNGPIFGDNGRFGNTNYFIPPSGTTAQRFAGIATAYGALRYNTDSQKLEYYGQDQWWEFSSSSESLNGSNRGLFGGGYSPAQPANVNNIEYITISSTGNSTDFGDLTVARYAIGGTASRTRGIFAGGNPGTNIIEYVTISSTGNSTDFGDLTRTNFVHNGASGSNTRGIFAGGVVNIIDYITIASTGNAVDFGDQSGAGYYGQGAFSSKTRSVFGGGRLNPSPTAINNIEYVTIATTGNSTDFGDLWRSVYYTTASGNVTRGVFGGGSDGTNRSHLQSIQIATLGNAVDFGDLTVTGLGGASGNCSSPTRGVYAGRLTPATTNIIEFITFTTATKALDFGDLSYPQGFGTACSNGHGGL